MQDNAEGIQQLQHENARLRQRVAELEQQTKEQDRQHALFHAIIEHSPAAIFVKDIEGRFLIVNQLAASLLQRSPQQIIGKTEQDVVPAEIAEAWQQIRERVITAGIPIEVIEDFGLDEEQHTYLSVDYPLYNEYGGIYAVGGFSTNITSQKQGEAALRESEELFRQLAENIHQVFWIRNASDQQLIYISPAYEKIWGQSCESLYTDPGSFLASVHPDDAERVQAALGRYVQGENFDEEYRIVRPDGEVRYVWARTFPVRNEQGEVYRFAGIAEDITRMKQTEQDLQEREERYRLLSENARDMICLHEPDGTYLYVSKAALDLLGYQPVELLGTSPYALFHPDDSERIVQESHAKASAGESANTIEYRIRHKDGSYIWFETSTRPILDKAGQVVKLQTVSRDISERKRVQAELQQAHDELEKRVAERTAELQLTNQLLSQENAERMRIEAILEDHRASLARQVAEQTADLRLANAQLERAARLKDEFLANMSHELRTPLNAVLGLTEAILEEIYGPLTPRQHRALDSIEESGRHLLAMINDILDLAKIEAGKVDLNTSLLSVEEICQSSLRFIRSSASKKRISIFESQDSQVDYLLADERRLKQILVNLLGNAVKFTPEGGEIGLEVTGDSERHIVHFMIWDTGVGIAQEDLKRLFRPFTQIDSGLSRYYEGSGLGLALVLRLAELHGGSVAVESEVGQGSRFTVSLPWKTRAGYEHAATESSKSLEQPGSNGPPGHPLPLQKALIIEDSPTAAEQLSRYLTELEIQSVVVGHGEQAVARAEQLQPDIIILDVLLPDISGWEVLQALKADAHTEGIPVVVISVVDERTRGINLGAVDYLLKPITRQQIYAMLQKIFPVEQPQPVRQTSPLAPADVAAPSMSETLPLVLLAEDNEDTIAMLSDYLLTRGYRCIVARSGAEAIESAREHQPALILMDIQMPVMDGLEAIQHIRADADMAAIPIIALTALAMPGDRERCLAAGANEYMSKPVSLKHLICVIDNHL